MNPSDAIANHESERHALSGLGLRTEGSALGDIMKYVDVVLQACALPPSRQIPSATNLDPFDYARRGHSGAATDWAG
jgi:hypothetical protein